MGSLLYLNKALVFPHLFNHSDNHHAFFSRFPLLLPTTKPKLLFVLGSSGTGKSKLAVSLALRFAGEVINSDKMQVYDGLHVITNKVTADECAGVPHHLIGGVHPDADFSAAEFCRLAATIADEIVARGRLPIIAGGSNSYIKKLIGVDGGDFARRYDCCFVWVDVEMSVLDEFVAERVDRMVEKGLVEEARGVFDGAGDYSKGVRRSIGVAEMDKYLRREGEVGEVERAAMREEAIGEIKANTWRLTRVQREKIRRFEEEDGWRLNRVDATAAVARRGEMGGGMVWEETVVGPSVEMVRRFVGGTGGDGFVRQGGGGVGAVAEETVVVGTSK